MYCATFQWPTPVVTDANTIQWPTLLVCVWAKNTGVTFSQWAGETIVIWHDKGGLTA